MPPSRWQDGLRRLLSALRNLLALQRAGTGVDLRNEKQARDQV